MLDLKPYFGNRPHRYFPSTLSTMTDARAWLAENPHLPSGAVILADEQRAGKGRLGRTWITPPQSAIAMSIIFREEWLASSLTMLGGVAVAEVLSEYCADVNLKWANDVQIGPRKVSGILAESLWDENRFQAAILGIGVNLTVNFGGTELAETATSLAQHTDQSLDRFAISTGILQRLDHWRGESEIYQSSQYMGVSPSPIFLAWKNRLSTLGQMVNILAGASTITGRAVDVESDGALILELADGTRQRFVAGDVSLRRAE